MFKTDVAEFYDIFEKNAQKYTNRSSTLLILDGFFKKPPAAIGLVSEPS